MTPSRAAVLVLGVNLIAVWMAAAAGRMAPGDGQTASRIVPAHEAVDQARSAMEAATGRLSVHERQRMAPAVVVRNAFRFTVQTRLTPGVAGPAAQRAAAAGLDPGAPELALVEFVLAGMAETRTGDEVHRTAILMVGADMVLATVGSEVAGRYRVAVLSADSVELDDLRGGPRVTVRLKPSPPS